MHFARNSYSPHGGPLPRRHVPRKPSGSPRGASREPPSPLGVPWGLPDCSPDAPGDYAQVLRRCRISNWGTPAGVNLGPDGRVWTASPYGTKIFQNFFQNLFSAPLAPELSFFFRKQYSRLIFGERIFHFRGRHLFAGIMPANQIVPKMVRKSSPPGGGPGGTKTRGPGGVGGARYM